MIKNIGVHLQMAFGLENYKLLFRSASFAVFGWSLIAKLSNVVADDSSHRGRGR